MNPSKTCALNHEGISQAPKSMLAPVSLEGIKNLYYTSRSVWKFQQE